MQCTVVQIFPQVEKGEYVENKCSLKGAVLYAGKKRGEKKEPTLYPDDALSKLERKKGPDEKQDKSSEGANLNITFSFLYAQMSAQDSRISVMPLSLGPHIRISDIISPYWAPAEPKQLLLSSSPGATRKDRGRETPYGFLDAHLFQLSAVLYNSVFYSLTVDLIFLYFPPFYLI